MRFDGPFITFEQVERKIPHPGRPLKYKLEVNSALTLEELARVRDKYLGIPPSPPVSEEVTRARQERFEKTWGKPCSRERLDMILAVAPIFGIRLHPVPGNPGLLAWYDPKHGAFRTVSRDALLARLRNLARKRRKPHRRHKHVSARHLGWR